MGEFQATMNKIKKKKMGNRRKVFELFGNLFWIHRYKWNDLQQLGEKVS